MLVNGSHHRAIEWQSQSQSVQILDQTLLPHRVQFVSLLSSAQMMDAIANMQVRGAPLVGASGAFGMVLAAKESPVTANLESAAIALKATRPTAVNLAWAVDQVLAAVMSVSESMRFERALEVAQQIADDDVRNNERIGEYGAAILVELWEQKGRPERLNVLTHCNAGWLATVDWGTALSPVYKAVEKGVPVHVWVDETRPRNQGMFLTAWELLQQGIDHSVIADNVGGHLMQHGLVDACIVGSDRTTANGDMCNKIGTYLKALAAHDNNVPFYASVPRSTIDRSLKSGWDIPIEQRDDREVTHMAGLHDVHGHVEVMISPEGSAAANYAFDVTPARYMTGLITECGVIEASEQGVASVFTDFKEASVGASASSVMA